MIKSYHTNVLKYAIIFVLATGRFNTCKAANIHIKTKQQISIVNIEYQNNKYSCGTKQALPCIEKITGKFLGLFCRSLFFYLKRLYSNLTFSLIHKSFIAETVLDCIAAGSLNPISLYRCISDAIGIDSSCHDCICYVMEKFGIECNKDLIDSIENLEPKIEIIS